MPFQIWTACFISCRTLAAAYMRSQFAQGDLGTIFIHADGQKCDATQLMTQTLAVLFNRLGLIVPLGNDEFCICSVPVPTSVDERSVQFPHPWMTVVRHSVLSPLPWKTVGLVLSFLSFQELAFLRRGDVTWLGSMLPALCLSTCAIPPFQKARALLVKLNFPYIHLLNDYLMIF